MNIKGIEFKQVESSNENFKDIIPFRAFATALKQVYDSTSLDVSTVLQGDADDARFIIMRLDNGSSATLPVSKKATVGSKVDDMYVAQTYDDAYIVCTTMHESSRF